ncbi:hypothetical protein A4X13_0g7503 [Tilletia indica]|uniref:Reverse transcriptase n=1 Tax=Tilletia indica TaxID=43049 RepID=A0A8T8SJ59_9BASI|nr:hypothetical protein A4X13_0g7503 [Tilletia indica]
MSQEDVPARNTRAATAAAAAEQPSTAENAPWSRDLQAAVDTLRSEVHSRFGSVTSRLDETDNQLRAVRSDLALQYQNLVDLIRNPTSAAPGEQIPAPPATTAPPATAASPAPFITVTRPTPLQPPAPAAPQGSTTPGLGPAPWSRGPAFKSAVADVSDDKSASAEPTLHLTTEPSSSPIVRMDQSGTITVSAPGVPKGYTIKSSDIGTFDGTPEDLELFLARVEALNDSESDANWKQAVLRAMPLLLRGYAASWHQTLEPSKRRSLTSLVNWFTELRSAFSADPTYMRQLARARAWQPDHEDIVGYIFDKTALLKAAFVGVPDSEVIFDVVERLPVSIRKLLRTPLASNASLVDLRNELRMQEQFWRAETGRPLVRTSTSPSESTSASKPPRYSSFAGPTPTSIGPTGIGVSSAPATTKSMTSAPPSASRRPPGKSIAEDFDGSRLEYGIEPTSKKRMMRYRVPGTDRVMWCQRPCRRCGSDHFDFAHDYCASHTIASINTAAADDQEEFDYLVTMEEEVNGSEPPPPQTQPLLRSEPDVGKSVESQTFCSPPDAPIIGQGCKSSVERAAPPTGPGRGLHAGYSSKLPALAAGEGSGPPLDLARQGPSSRDVSSSPIVSSGVQNGDLLSPPTDSGHDAQPAVLHFADRPLFQAPRVLPVSADLKPLARSTRRQGPVVVLGRPEGIGTGQQYRNHVPLSTHIHVNDTTSPPLSTLLDTGASMSVIDAAFLETLGGHVVGTPMLIHGLGDVTSLGWVTITFFIPARDSRGTSVMLECAQDFHVLPHFAPLICLGLDFIQPQGVQIDVRHDRAIVGRYTFATHEKMPTPYTTEGEVCTTSTCFLPARTMTWVPVDVASLAPGVDYTIHPRLTVSPDETVQLAGPAAVATRATSHILIANHGEKGIHLDRRTPIADACAAHLGDVASTQAHTFTLSPPLPPGGLIHALTAGSVWSASPGQDYSDSPASPPDLYDELPEPPSPLIGDAATTMVDDHFRVGVDKDGKPPAEIVDVLRRHQAAFALDGRPGLIVGAEMEISLQPEATLHAEPPRRASPEKRAAMDAALDQLLEWDVVEPSSSPVSFPVLMVRQHTKWRFCVDYRQLNQVTVADRYPLPTTDAVFNTLLGKHWFSSLDAIRGYHRHPVKESDRWKTAFVCHRGLFQYKTVPFGLRNAPAVFQRLMDKLLGELRWKEAVVYIDDVVVATVTLDEHVRALEILLSRASQAGLKFSPSKCTFAIPSLVLLGRKVSGAGVAVWQDRAKAVQDLPRPRTLQELYHALGLFNYYRAFIPHFAEIAAPLSRLTKGWRYERVEGRTRLTDLAGDPTAASRVQLEWSDEQQRSFDLLKAAISNPPVLAHPDPSRPYILYVDASKQAYAAILHQVFATSESGPAEVRSLLPAPTSGVSKERWMAWLRADPFFRKVLSSGEQGETGWIVRDGLLLRRSDSKIALPEAAVPILLAALHDARGHFGFTKTYLAVSRHFWRPKLVEAVLSWIRHCTTCQKTKLGKKTGELDVGRDPQFPFEFIATDLVLGLPCSRAGKDALLVILDVFSRMVLLHPCSANIDAAGIAAILSDRVLRYGWRPRRLISDSEAKMTGSVMQALATSLGASLTPDAVPTSSSAGQRGRALRPDRATGASRYRPFDLVFVAQPDIVHAVFDASDHDGVGAFGERLAAASARLQEARDAVAAARSRQKIRYDRTRAPLPVLAEGDEVYIRLSN